MKNNTIPALLLLVASFKLSAQDSKFHLGIRFAPNIAFTRVEDVKSSDGISYETEGAGVRYSAGLTGEYFIGKTFAVYSGIWYNVQKAGVKVSDESGTPKISGTSIHNLQYVQVPVGFKLVTDEVGTDLKLYFVVAGTLGLKINEKEKEWNTNEIKVGESELKYRKPGAGNGYTYFDAGLLLTAGIEYKLSESNSLFVGLSYNRGLTEIQSKKGPFNTGQDAGDSFKVRAALLSLEVGIKF